MKRNTYVERYEKMQRDKRAEYRKQYERVTRADALLASPSKNTPRRMLRLRADSK
jgi:uncharacterized protein VirK/YbjX